MAIITSKPTTINKDSTYTNYLYEKLKEYKINFTQLIDLGYEPDYQGMLMLLVIDPNQKDKLEPMIVDVNMGDDSFLFTELNHTNWYLIDIYICQ